MRKRKRNDPQMDLTSGPIFSQLVLFALPFLGSSLIQQLYSTTDLIFAGQFLGREASAAIGNTSILVTVIIGLFTGLGIGTGTHVARLYGEKDFDAVKRAVRSAMGLTAVIAATFMALGILLAPVMLKWIRVPGEVIPFALTYIRIYFVSMISMVIYNVSTGILRALGDSRSPMMCQLAGGIANVFFNTLFIVVFKWGIAGAATATLLSQTVAAALTLRRLFIIPEEYRPDLSGMRIERRDVRAILSVGIPAAVQASIITFSNLCIQSSVNSLGVVTIAAFTAYFKVENFIYYPIMAIGQANAVFIGQNYGAGNSRRIKEGMTKSLVCGIVIAVLLSMLILCFRGPVFRLFSADSDVISLGGVLAGISFPFYFLYVIMEVLAGSLRAFGKALYPAVITMINMCGVRLMLLYHVMSTGGTAERIVALFPVTWAAAVICLAVCFMCFGKQIFSVTKQYPAE